jgi:hypothetical protein
MLEFLGFLRPVTIVPKKDLGRLRGPMGITMDWWVVGTNLNELQRFSAYSYCRKPLLTSANETGSKFSAYSYCGKLRRAASCVQL